MITVEQLERILPNNEDLYTLCATLNKILPKYEINTKNRIAGFLAQCAVESVGFTKFQENLNYGPNSLMQTWPHLFPTVEKANEYARQPQKIANYVYSNKYGNGDQASGDGWTYRGRGAIQTTFYANYKAFADYKGITIKQAVDYCEILEGAIESACFYWKKNKINESCDADDIEGMTHKINPGLLGLQQRKEYYEKAKVIL
jgi:putative chitinase